MASDSMKLGSGRKIKVLSQNEKEQVTIENPDGEVILKVELTEAGPIVRLKGAHLKLEALKSISLESDSVKISSKKSTVLKSKGTTDVFADDEIKVQGKMIHLN